MFLYILINFIINNYRVLYNAAVGCPLIIYIIITLAWIIIIFPFPFPDSRDHSSNLLGICSWIIISPSESNSFNLSTVSCQYLHHRDKNNQFIVFKHASFVPNAKKGFTPDTMELYTWYFGLWLLNFYDKVGTWDR